MPEVVGTSALPAIERAVPGFDQVHIDRGIASDLWHVTAQRYDPAVGNMVGRRVTVAQGTPPTVIAEQLELAYAGQYHEEPGKKSFARPGGVKRNTKEIAR